jgi:hypothetical protein
LEVIVLGWVGSAILPEGRAYIRDGISDCAHSQGVIRWSQKSPFTESHGKGTDDLVSLGSCEGVKEDVVANSDGLEVSREASPRPSLVLVCASRNCSLTGSFCSNEVSHELHHFVGSSAMCKC